MKITAVGDHIIVKTIKTEKTEGGIHIPDGASPLGMLIGQVISACETPKPGYKNLTLVRNGDIIIYHKSTQLDLEGELLEAVDSSDVVAVIEAEKEDKEREETP